MTSRVRSSEAGRMTAGEETCREETVTLREETCAVREVGT